MGRLYSNPKSSFIWKKISKNIFIFSSQCRRIFLLFVPTLARTPPTQVLLWLPILVRLWSLIPVRRFLPTPILLCKSPPWLKLRLFLPILLRPYPRWPVPRHLRPPIPIIWICFRRKRPHTALQLGHVCTTSFALDVTKGNQLKNIQLKYKWFYFFLKVLILLKKKYLSIRSYGVVLFYSILAK